MAPQHELPAVVFLAGAARGYTPPRVDLHLTPLVRLEGIVGGRAPDMPGLAPLELGRASSNRAVLAGMRGSFTMSGDVGGEWCY